MHRVILAAVGLLFSAAAFPAPDCALCRDELTKTLEVCKSEPTGAAHDVCREDAFRKAKSCEDEKGSACNLDLLMESPKKSSES